jgi:DNA-binding NarL/FixJ family response regulator
MTPTPTGERVLGKLTARQREALTWLCSGLTNKQIAEKMGIGEQPVKNYMRVILLMAGMTNRLELMIFAFRHGMVECPCGSDD